MKTLAKYAQLDILTLSYLAAFVDADGSIICQLVTRKTGFMWSLVVSLSFYQLERRGGWFFPFIKAKFNNVGRVELYDGDMSRYVISAQPLVADALILLYPFLHLKKRQAKYGLDIILGLRKLAARGKHHIPGKSAALDPYVFITLCKKAARIQELNDSKHPRVILYKVVASFKQAGLLKESFKLSGVLNAGLFGEDFIDRA